MENSDFPHLNSESLKIHRLRDEKQWSPSPKAVNFVKDMISHMKNSRVPHLDSVIWSGGWKTMISLTFCFSFLKDMVKHEKQQFLSPRLWVF
jgi:hypothetical protein